MERLVDRGNRTIIQMEDQICERWEAKAVDVLHCYLVDENKKGAITLIGLCSGLSNS